MSGHSIAGSSISVALVAEASDSRETADGFALLRPEGGLFVAKLLKKPTDDRFQWAVIRR